ncbi:MAG: transposase [Luteolibacter sp.]
MFLNPYEPIERGRHKLPHWQQCETWVFVTWRLADSLPKAKLDEWNERRSIWLDVHPQPWDEATDMEFQEKFGDEVDRLLDNGSGSCVLKKPENAEIVADALHHFNGSRYSLSDFVVMPNHVHVLFSPHPDHQLADIIHSWKRHTARKINSSEGKSGALWQPDYWDRLIRSRQHFDWVKRYIAKNPKHLNAGAYKIWSAAL